MQRYIFSHYGLTILKDMTEKLSGSAQIPVIRPATMEDIPAILGLVRQLAEYERAADKVTATEETFRNAYVQGYFESLVAEVEGMIVGMALYYRTFSTWK